MHCDERRAGGLEGDEENGGLSTQTARGQSDGEAAGTSIPGVAGRDTPNDRNRR